MAFATEKKATRHLNKNGDAVILNESLVEKGKKPIVETEALYQLVAKSTRKKYR